MQMHSGIGEKSRGLGRKELTRHADQRGVELDQVDPFNGGMLERLRHAAARAAADEQHAPRRRMLQQRVVN